MARILVMDDDEMLLATLAQFLALEGHVVATAPDGLAGAKLIRSESFDLIITDIVMPNREGLESIISLRREYPEIGVIAMSGWLSNSRTYLAMAAQLGAHRTLTKPFTPQELNDAIAGAKGESAWRAPGNSRSAPACEWEHVKKVGA